MLFPTICKIFILGMAVSATLTAGAVTGILSKEGLTVSNDHYQLFFNHKNGYTLRQVTISGKKTEAAAGLVVWYDGETETYQKRYPAVEKPIYCSTQPVQYRIIENNAKRFVIQFDRKFERGSIIERISFDDSPLVRFDVEFNYSHRPFAIDYQLAVWNVSGIKGEGRFFPGNRRDICVREDFPWNAAPCWNYFYNSAFKWGIGLVAPQDGGELAGIVGNTKSRNEGWNTDVTMLKVSSPQLRYKSVPGKTGMHFYLLAGTDPEKIAAAVAPLLPVPSELSVEDLRIDKLAVAKGGRNRLTAQLVNRSDSPRKVKLSAICEYGLKSSFTIAPAESLTLPPRSTTVYEKKWQFPPEMEWGGTVKLSCDDGSDKPIVREEYCGVSDTAAQVVGYGICSPNFCNNEGSEAAWLEAFKRNYIGLIEFYCWYPSSIGGLAPKEDAWQPHTELEGMTGTSPTISKRYLRNFINAAHARGIKVYAMVTGLVNYHYGLQNPKYLQYCINGQPAVYNGRINKGKRFSVWKPNAYTEEFASRWGNEMADSIDMFGWDGCRWDWNFIPDKGNDPYYHNRTDLPDWYDYRGIPSKQLYPDADTTAANATKAWINAIHKRHPEFQYGANFRASDDMARRYPKTLKQSATNSLLLFEYLIGVWSPKYGTFQKWAAALQNARELVRRDGATPTVGTMHGLALASYSKRLAHYTCAAAGVRWWGYASFGMQEKEYEVNRYFTRFCEYYFNSEFVPLSEAKRNTEIAISGSRRVYSGPLVYERPTTTGREVTVHLLNLPEESDYICQRHVIPPVRRDTVISVKPRSGEKLSRAFAVLPFADEKQRPGAIELPIAEDRVTLPELKEAAVIIFQFKVFP